VVEVVAAEVELVHAVMEATWVAVQRHLQENRFINHACVFFVDARHDSLSTALHPTYRARGFNTC